jgi:hypothetical protein
LQLPLPHTQSAGQLNSSSHPGQQNPSPHTCGQSHGQLTGVSLPERQQSPQTLGQSNEQLQALSPGSHVPSPQHPDGQVPATQPQGHGQSAAHVSQPSPPSQTPLPQHGANGQSAGHVTQLSGATQQPSAHSLQSLPGHVHGLSPGSQKSSEQPTHAPPMHASSGGHEQSTTQVAQSSPDAPSHVPLPQIGSMHAPPTQLVHTQSPGQVEQFSPANASQLASPHGMHTEPVQTSVGGQGQSAHAQVSPGSHTPSTQQQSIQGPQSAGQCAQPLSNSPGSQTPLPHCAAAGTASKTAAAHPIQRTPSVHACRAAHATLAGARRRPTAEAAGRTPRGEPGRRALQF